MAKELVKDASFFDRIDMLNVDYYEQALENVGANRNLDLEKRREIVTHYKNVIKNIQDLKHNINLSMHAIKGISDEVIINNLLRSSLYQLSEIKKYMTNDKMTSEDFLLKFDKENEKIKKQRNKDHKNQIKTANELYDVEEKLKKCSHYHILIDDKKYEEYRVPLEKLNLGQKDKKDNTFCEKLYDDLSKRCRRLPLDSHLDFSNNNKQEKEVAQSLNVNLDKLRNLYELMKSSRKMDKVTEKININIDPDVLTLEGIEAYDKLQNLNSLKKHIENRPAKYKLKISDVNDTIKLFNYLVELSVNVKIMNTVLDSFEIPGKKVPDTYAALTDIKNHYDAKLKDISKRANNFYERLEIDNILSDAIKYDINERRMKGVIYDKDDLAEYYAKYPNLDRYEAFHENAQVMSKLREEQEELLENSDYLSDKKTDIDKVIEDLNKNGDYFSQFRSAYYSDYIMDKNRYGTDLTFVEYLKKTGNTDLENLIEFEQNKSQVINAIYRDFKHAYPKEQYYDLNKFKHFCDNQSDLMRRLGGIDSIIKESDLEDFIESINKADKRANELKEMLSEEEEKQTYSEYSQK